MLVEAYFKHMSSLTYLTSNITDNMALYTCMHIFIRIADIFCPSLFPRSKNKRQENSSSVAASGLSRFV